jgi:hypothetical protein
MSNPDWTEAPEGATHYDCNADVFCTVNGWWSCKGKYYHMPCQMAWGSERYTPRPVEPAPTAWNGTGFPPVGTKCEGVWLEVPDGGDRVFEGVIVKGYYKKQVWFCTTSGEDITHLTENVDFRPLRTPEQRERQSVIEQAFSKLSEFHDADQVLGDLYDAGMLHKQED